jgi:hypothetical protein
VVEQHDFYVDTQEIVDFDRKLAERGVEAVPWPRRAGAAPSRAVRG